MTLRRVSIAALALAANTAITATPVHRPFEFLEPSVQISADDRAKLDEQPAARTANSCPSAGRM
jgi:hypothetical protein